MSSNTIRSELLEFLNALQNEVQMFDVDPECSEFESEPGIVDKFRATIAAVERMYPLIQMVDEMLLGEISPKLFWHKWEQVKVHLDYQEDEDEPEIGDDVTNFLKGFDKGEPN